MAGENMMLPVSMTRLGASTRISVAWPIALPVALSMDGVEQRVLGLRFAGDVLAEGPRLGKGPSGM